MLAASDPPGEDLPAAIRDPERLAAVRATGLLDSAASASFDQLARLASRLLGTPMAFVTVVDDWRSYWASSVGVEAAPPAGRQNRVQESFCQYVVADAAPVIIGNAAENPRTSQNPSVSSMGVRAWAGFPLLDATGHVLGSFCVVDTTPRDWTGEEIEMLGVLARAASAQVAVLNLVAAERDARDALDRMRVSELRAEARLQRLATAALELLGAETLEDLTQIVVNGGLPILGSDGGAVGVCVEPDSIRLAVSDRLARDMRVMDAVLPMSSPLPSAYVARTGQRLFLGSRAAGLAFSAGMASVYERTSREAWAFVPLRIGPRLLGSLAVSWVDERDFSDDEVELIEGFAAQCAQALDRIQQRHDQQQNARAVRRMSESLQRSLLTQPPTPDTLEIAVRYQPAAQHTQVGGDWYDAFVNASGSTMVVVGDVTGHDRMAAAAMGQVRNILRGIAFDSDEGPAVILSRLDAALLGLEVGTLATAVLARVDQVAGPGAARLSWSNAGHLPPLLRQPDGTVEELGGDHDLLLGLDPLTRRVDRFVDLVEGSTLLLYTDGLVERRDLDIEDGVRSLAEIFGRLGGQDPSRVCDAVLAATSTEDNEDDIALLVLRCGPRLGAAPYGHGPAGVGGPG